MNIIQYYKKAVNLLMLLIYFRLRTLKRILGFFGGRTNQDN